MKIIRAVDGGHEHDFDINLKQYRHRPTIVFAMQMDDDFQVETLEGVMAGKRGDYLVCGIKGEYYPVRQDIFEESYVPRERARAA